MPMQKGREVTKLYHYKEALPQSLNPIHFTLHFWQESLSFDMHVAASLKLFLQI